MRYELALIECLIMASERNDETLREALHYARGLNPRRFSRMPYSEFEPLIKELAQKKISEVFRIIPE